MSKDFELDLNIPLYNLEGENVSAGKTIGQIIANTLVGESDGDSLKIFGWCMKLANNEKLILDASDKKVLYQLIDSNKRMTILLKAPALKAFG